MIVVTVSCTVAKITNTAILQHLAINIISAHNAVTNTDVRV